MICGTSVVPFDKLIKENPLYSGFFSIGGDGKSIFCYLIMDNCSGGVKD